MIAKILINGAHFEGDAYGLFCNDVSLSVSSIHTKPKLKRRGVPIDSQSKNCSNMLIIYLLNIDNTHKDNTHGIVLCPILFTAAQNQGDTINTEML